METYLLPGLLAIAGGFFLFRNIVLLRNDDKLRQYLTTSPKGKLWVGKLGLEKTVALTRNIILPLGCFVAAVFLVLGIWSLSSLAFYGCLPDWAFLE